MGSEATPAPVRRLEEFVNTVAAGLADAIDASAVALEDHAEAAKILELLGEHFGGRIADPIDVEDAIKDAVAVLEGGLQPDHADQLQKAGRGTLGALILSVARERARSHAALLALHQIHAMAIGRSDVPSSELPINIEPVDVLAEVHEALSRARSFSWSASTRGAA